MATTHEFLIHIKFNESELQDLETALSVLVNYAESGRTDRTLQNSIARLNKYLSDKTRRATAGTSASTKTKGDIGVKTNGGNTESIEEKLNEISGNEISNIIDEITGIQDHKLDIGLFFTTDNNQQCQEYKEFYQLLTQKEQTYLKEGWVCIFVSLLFFVALCFSLSLLFS